MNFTREEYREYMSSSTWKHKRKNAMKRVSHQCQLCGFRTHAANLVVHHNSYTNFGHEKPEDLTVLCERCHRGLHEKHKLRVWQFNLLVTFGSVMESIWETAFARRRRTA